MRRGGLLGGPELKLLPHKVQLAPGHSAIDEALYRGQQGRFSMNRAGGSAMLPEHTPDP